MGTASLMDIEELVLEWVKGGIDLLGRKLRRISLIMANTNCDFLRLIAPNSHIGFGWRNLERETVAHGLGIDPSNTEAVKHTTRVVEVGTKTTEPNLISRLILLPLRQVNRTNTTQKQYDYRQYGYFPPMTMEKMSTPTQMHGLFVIRHAILLEDIGK